MIKILQINVTANWGSTGRIAEGIGEAILNEGWESYIAYGRNSNLSASNLIRVGTKMDMYYHILQTRLGDRHGLASKHATLKFIEIVKQLSPDIIHLHNIHGYYLNYKMLFAYLSRIGIPIVWTLHDCWAYTGHCSYYSEVNCSLWKSECTNCIQQHNYPSSIFYDRCRNNFNDKKKAFTSVKNMILVPVSYWLGREMRFSFLNKYQVCAIHNGIDTELFKVYPSVKAKYNIENCFLILGVANIWDERKGLKDMLTLSGFLRENEFIILVGVSDKQIRKLPPNIIGIKRTDSIQCLAQLYSSADVFINTSVEETFGLTTVESMACGTPVIVYNSTACSEVVTEDVGFVVDKHNINQILEAVEIVKSQSKSYYQQVCREYAVSLFDKSKCYAKYIQLYKKILNMK